MDLLKYYIKKCEEYCNNVETSKPYSVEEVRPIVKYLKELKELRELRKIIHQYAYEEGVKDLKNFITNSKEVDTIIIKGSALNDIVDKLISENNK